MARSAAAIEAGSAGPVSSAAASGAWTDSQVSILLQDRVIDEVMA